ncbi:type I restriction-modification system, specificity subunit S [Aquipluma nitroreducens]|uniref:Type I restriction-modification system, specificity subunit S n=1 Tax=Aquipluma nitroreducens TaxID=2010828 RepID=A0A5K7S3K1_9BACT|nr:restriction endonuclease subunit S [Aquipluma nitroreducens]BBE16060.1 type I restriction-modification system, specificity subunit S [Aquipluma nitroreducens]
MSQNIRIEIPSSWLQVGLSDLFLDPKNNIVDGPFGSNLKASEYKEEGVPIIRIQNIDRNKFIDKNINYVTEEKAEFLSRHSFQSGDIIITKLGTPVGKACFVPEIFERGIIVADLIRVRIDNDNINEKFLVYQINSSFLITQFEKFTKGTTRPRINLSIVRELKFNLPPLKEQQRIVAVIEELFSDLDNGIANLKLAQNQLKVYRQALLKYAFNGKLTEKWRLENNPESTEKLLESFKEERIKRYKQELTEWKKSIKQWEEDGKKGAKPLKLKKNREITDNNHLIINTLPAIPVNWKYTKLGNIGNLERGKSKHRPRNDARLFGGEYPFIQTGEVRNSNVAIRKYEKTYSDFGLQQSKLWKKGTLCITIAANIAETAFLGFDACFPDSVVGFTPEKEPTDRYLFHFLEFNKTKIEEFASATAQKNINLNILDNLYIPFCTLKEQEEIINYLDSTFSIVDNIQNTIEKSFQKSEALRHSILKKAFQGKLVEQNSDEEPASEILRRIKVEKAKYLRNQKQEKKKVPQKIKKMSNELSIEEVLNTSNKPMLAVDVWQQSRHKGNIEEFYSELKKIQEKIKEVKNGTESLMSLKS